MKQVFNTFKWNFPKSLTRKWNEWIWKDSPMQELITDIAFSSKVEEKSAWAVFKKYVMGSSVIHDLATTRISFKNFFLLMMVCNAISFFPENLGVWPDENAEIFHQDILLFERSNSNKWSEAKLADFYWSIHRETSI